MFLFNTRSYFFRLKNRTVFFPYKSQYFYCCVTSVLLYVYRHSFSKHGLPVVSWVNNVVNSFPDPDLSCRLKNERSKMAVSNNALCILVNNLQPLQPMESGFHMITTIPNIEPRSTSVIIDATIAEGLFP